MLTDEGNQLESKDDESLSALPLLPDTEETALLLEDAVISGNIATLSELILLQHANINSQYLYTNHTSLLATAVMNKRATIVEWLLILQLNYLITTADIEEIRELINELKKIKASDKLDEEKIAALKAGLAVLCALKQGIKDTHFKTISDQIKISDIRAEINDAIAELSPRSTAAGTTNNTVNAATTTPAISPAPVLHAFQDVNAPATGTNLLFLSIARQEFDKFSLLLKWLISQNAMFDINEKDKEGKTLLHHASINPDDRFLKVLLENKANPNVGDKHNWTPVHWSAFTGKNFDVFMADSIAHPIPINWSATTQKGETIFRLALKGKKIVEPNLLSSINVKCSDATKSKNPNLH